jgi:hypothetical protein
LIGFELFKRGEIADREIGIVADTAKQNFIFSEIIGDDVADFIDEIRRLIGLRSNLVEVIDDNFANDGALSGCRALIWLSKIGAVFKNEQTLLAQIFDLIKLAFNLDFDHLVGRGIDQDL